MAIVMIRHTFDVVNGPNRDSLFDSAKRSQDKIKIPVTFVSAQQHKYDAIITSIEHEDGSGHSFNLKGCLADPKLSRENSSRYYIPFEGYFHCRARNNTRAGCLTVAVQYATPNTDITDKEYQQCCKLTQQTYC